MPVSRALGGGGGEDLVAPGPLCEVQLDDQRFQSCSSDIARAAPDRRAVLVEDLHLVPDRFRIAEDVAGIGEARNRAQSALLAAASDHDRYAVRTNRARHVVRLVDLVIAALERRR